ncbi:STAS/SEC14 domain-containing protein [Rufibacter sp. LB8]|uniref:STAS/SEC14 domain-containing protein n=1 Tax=Rufibacter sp. LB8 TaxID=2777781 RepID=UPI00178C3439|nr:STAS/SEC14 domain-containing protein [Rufibacter sp. LB8]
MIQELTNSFGKVYLTIKTDAVNKWVQVSWKGYLTPENLRTGAKAYVEVLQQANFNRVLNDTRAVIGSWDHSIDWVLNEWAPKAAQAGLRYFAMVAAPESLADTTAGDFSKKLVSFKAEVFQDLQAAQAWLAKPYLDPVAR